MEEMTGINLHQITSGITEGNEADFNTFYDEYAPRIYRYLIVVTNGNEELVKDIHQESMVKMVRYMKPFDDEAYLWNWLISITKSCLADHYRRNFRKLPQVKLIENDSTKEPPMLKLLPEAIQALPEGDQALIRDFYYADKSQKALAAERGTTPEAIGMKMMRIRKALKRLILGKMTDE